MKELTLPTSSEANQKPKIACPRQTNQMSEGAKNQKRANSAWHVYILECQDGSFYTGTTNDIDKRMKTHAEGTGSKYVRHKKFKKLLATKECADRSDACKAECKIRKLHKREKLNWFDK